MLAESSIKSIQHIQRMQERTENKGQGVGQGRREQGKSTMLRMALNQPTSTSIHIIFLGQVALLHSS
jgi:hypothetical protein